VCRQPDTPAAEGAARLELADVFRLFAHELPELTAHRAAVVRDIMRCRTPELGGHVDECDECGRTLVLYNSCRNRHCPKCQSLSQARWLEARQADLLPVEYFHVVFTVPAVLRPVFLAQPRTCYKLLFAAVAETLKEVAENPARLGARIGLTAMLHTWTQKLLYHPHVHCIVPGGGIAPDGARWLSCKPRFFLPVKVLSVVFRAKLLDKLETALAKGDIRTPKSLPHQWLQHAAAKTWIVYSKRPFAGPTQVLRYLGSYTHRIAFSNHRLVGIDSRKVTFWYRDRADGNKRKLLTLDAVEFLRRFLRHVVPKRFVRIRHYGFLANPVRRNRVALCRTLLGAQPSPGGDPTSRETWQELLLRLTGIDPTLCPACKVGHMMRVRVLQPSVTVSLPGRATSP
jgi:Putative transposase/Transposase zinc-binding domain